jgi:hypothetical protein
MTQPNFEHLFSFTVRLHMPPEVIGPGPAGIRVNFYIAGGEMSGPRCNGKVMPVGGDWILIRRDGVGEVDVRLTMETADGALIYVVYNGVADPGPDSYEAFLNNTLTPTFPIRIAPRFSTAHPAYAWMNRVQAYGVGEVNMADASVTYHVYAVL